MISKKAIILFIILGLTPLLIFILKFYFQPISKSLNDWAVFATYFSGTSGTVFSILAFYMLYLTFQTQINQNIETTFFNYIETFSREKIDISDKIIKCNEELRVSVHRNEIVSPNSISEKNKKKEYLDLLSSD